MNYTINFSNGEKQVEIKVYNGTVIHSTEYYLDFVQRPEEEVNKRLVDMGYQQQNFYNLYEDHTGSGVLRFDTMEKWAKFFIYIRSTFPFSTVMLLDENNCPYSPNYFEENIGGYIYYLLH